MASTALALLLRLAVATDVAADVPADESAWPGGRPSVELESAFFANGAGAPDGRRVLRELLRSESHDAARIDFFASFGWVTLFEAGGAGGPHHTTRPGNLVVGGRYRLDRHMPFGLRLDAGIGAVLGLANLSPSAERRVARAAYLHAVAMDGAWDAWAWAPVAIGVVLPVRLASLHHLGRWRARLDVEATLAATRAKREGYLAYSERDPGRVVQAAAGYQVSPWPWLGAGTRVQLVWMPTAPVFRTQAAVCPSVIFARGAWRLATEVLVNVDEPYGFRGVGQHIWALHLGLGVWL